MNTNSVKNFSCIPATLLICFVLLCGCRSHNTAVAPSIQFTRVPQATLSDPDKLDIIQGRVTGARSGQQIVLYVRNGEMLDPAAAERAVHSKMKPSVCATMATEVAQRRSLIRDFRAKPIGLV